MKCDRKFDQDDTPTSFFHPPSPPLSSRHLPDLLTFITPAQFSSLGYFDTGSPQTYSFIFLL